MASHLNRNEQLTVCYRTNALDNWKPLTNYTQAVSSWTPQTIELPNPAKEYYIAFEGRSTTEMKGHGVCIGSLAAVGDLVAPESGFDAWRQDNFTGEGELDDPNISGPDADPDGDGIPNLLEYAMGLDPNDYDNDTWIWGGITNIVNHAEVDTGSYLFLKYRRANEVQDVKFTVIGTPSLTPPELNWSPIDILELTPWTLDDPTNIWSWVHNIHLTPTTNAPKRFMRLRVELE